MSTKPTIVFVPGAWHHPRLLEPVPSQLQAAGYKTKSVVLPCSLTPPIDNYEKDVEAIRQSVEEAAEQDEDVVVFMHSYAGVPGSQAVKGLDKASRRKDGKRGGVSHLFYCAAFVLPEGVSLMDALQGNDLPWFQVTEDKKTVTPATPETIFYNDLDKETADSYVSQLSPHSYQVFMSKCDYVGWRDIPSSYLFCTKDNAIPIEVQKGMIDGSGVKFTTETLDASHSPFLSMPDKTVAAIRRAAGETL